MKVFSQGASREKSRLCYFAVRADGGFTIERVALMLIIVPCRDLDLGCQT